MHRVRHLSAPSSASLRAPPHPCARALPRLTPALLWMAVLCVSLPSQASDGTHLKPVKLSAGGAAQPAASASGPARAPAAAASAARIDPLELLRRRLTERLSGGATVSTGASPNDMRVLAHVSPVDKLAAPAKPATRAARQAAQRKAEAGQEPQPVHWSYQGPAGPQSWAELKPEFALCGKGERQSPIDIRGGLAVDLEPVKFNYQDSPFGVIDNGRAVQANVATGNTIEVGGKRFELVQLQFHRPSEESIDGRQFEMSMHMVHKDAQGRLAVVAVLFDKGSAQPVVQKVLNNLPLEKGQELAARVPLDLAELLPTDRRYYTYMGSLTSPPCSEGVQWIVMRQPMSLSNDQIELFGRIYPMNARPLQQASGRRILQSE